MKKRVEVLTGILGFAGGAISIGRLISKSSNRWKNMSDKNLYNAQLLNQWYGKTGWNKNGGLV